MINLFPQASTLFFMPMNIYENGGQGFISFPSSLVVANSTVVTSSLYVPKPNFWENLTMIVGFVQNKCGPNDTLRSYNMRVRVYKNNYLIYDIVDPQSARTNYSYPEYYYSIPYGTMCDGDHVEVVYSLA